MDAFYSVIFSRPPIIKTPTEYDVRFLFVVRQPSSITYMAFNSRSIVLYDFKNPSAKRFVSVPIRTFETLRRTRHVQPVSVSIVCHVRKRAKTCEVCSYNHYWKIISRPNMIVWITSVTFPTRTHVHVRIGGIPWRSNFISSFGPNVTRRVRWESLKIKLFS